MVLTGVAISFLLFIGGGILLQQRNSRQQEEDVAGEPPKQVKLKVDSVEQAGKTANADASSAAGTTFLLEPSAEMLIAQLQDMQNLQADVAQKRLQALRVLWPVFFFEVRREAGKNIASFDISPDGFGIVVQAQYSPEKFPELDRINKGDRVWLGGEIAAVDLAGTGRVELQLEYVDLSSGIPGVVAPAENNRQQGAAGQ